MPWLSTVADSLTRHQGRSWRGFPAPSEPVNGVDGHAFADGDPLSLPAPSQQVVRMNGGGFSVERSSEPEVDLKLIYEAFDASQPVSDAAGLFGREEQLQRLLSGVLLRHHHGVVSGPRGSGKTSMVRVFGERAEEDGVVVLYSSNDAEAPFGLIMRQLLEQIPAFSLPVGEAEAFQARVHELDAGSGAQQVVNLVRSVSYSAVVIIIDEFDRVPDEAFKSQISSLLKLSSDARTRARFVLVGDERTYSEILKGHPSLGRHTTHVSTSPLSEPATIELLDSRARNAGMKFSEPARRLMTTAVCGSPYHARLFGLHAALRAHANGSSVIRVGEALAGLRNAYEEWASLNPDDAKLFLNVLTGENADQPIVKLAEHVAWQRGSASGNGGAAEVEQFRAGLEALSPAAQADNEGIYFRDTTAPQFLLALHLALSARTREASKWRKEKANS